MIDPLWIRTARHAMTLTLILLTAAVGCSRQSGKYPISGKVTYGDQPIRMGSITLEPTEGLVNKDTIALATIENGQFQTEVVGGPHLVSIRDLSGEASGDSAARASFNLEYTTKVDLPKTPAGDVVQDFQVPLTHR